MPTKLKVAPPEEIPAERPKTLIKVPPQLTPIPGAQPVKNPSSNQWLRNALMGSAQMNDTEPPTAPKNSSVKVNSDNTFGAEMRTLYNKNVSFDNKPAIDIVRSAATKAGVNPALLFSSAFQEGFNKSISKPNEVSDAYNKAKITKDYPVDGFYNYGLDTIGTKLPDLIKKGYLPADFANNMKVYPAKNEKNESVQTAAFKTNESALMAKAAFLRDTADQINSLAKSKGVTLDDKARNYFTLAQYNGGPGNAEKMLDEYAKAKDKKAFIEQGQTTKKGVHKNIYPRLQNIEVAQQLLNQ